jgi:hypothetical protein
VEGKRAIIRRVKYWEIIADNLSKAGWTWGCVSTVGANGRTIWIADARCDDGKRFVVRADEKLSAFMEPECAAIQECSKNLIFSNYRPRVKVDCFGFIAVSLRTILIG